MALNCNTCYFTFGRFQPPTTGHKDNFAGVKRAAGTHDYRIYISQSVDTKGNNPLPPDRKLMYMNKMFPEKEKPQRVKTGRPAGWHWMAEFVDKDGTVYHKGKEQPKLKGTLSPTEVKPKKQTKRRSQEEILLAREAKKKKELKKEFQKQKDLLSHRWGK